VAVAAAVAVAVAVAAGVAAAVAVAVAAEPAAQAEALEPAAAEAEPAGRSSMCRQLLDIPCRSEDLFVLHSLDPKPISYRALHWHTPILLDPLEEDQVR